MKSEFSCYPGKSWKNVSCEVPRLCVRAHGARTGAGVCLGGEGTPTKNGSSPLSTASYLSTSHSLPAPRRPFKPWEARAATIQPRVCGVDTFAPTEVHRKRGRTELLSSKPGWSDRIIRLQRRIPSGVQSLAA